MENRICKTCKNEKSIAKFAKTGDGKHRNRICRSCQHQKQRLNPRYMMSRMLSMARLRCEDPKNDSYSRYGGRGIKFKLDQEEFYKKFEKLVDNYIKAGDVPSIDRVNHNGNYEMNNVQIVSNGSNTAEMRVRLKDRYREARILKEQASNKKCKSCDNIVPTKDYYVSKHHEDGTVSRYSKCPKCEQEHRKKQYSSKSYYKGKVK